MRKICYIISALLLLGGMLLQSCGEKIEPEITPIDNEETTQVKTYTMSVAAAKSGIGTKALDLANGSLSATWKAGEKVTVYNQTRNTELKGYLEAQEEGVNTTLKGSVTGIVAANDKLTLKFLDSEYSNQDGTLAFIAAHCDYATAAVTVKSTTGGNVTTEAAASFTYHQAIVEFSLQESDGSAMAGGVSSLTVNAGGTVITVAPGSAKDLLYVAIPAFSNGTLSLSAVDPNGASRSYEEAGATFENGKFYKVGVKMDCVVKNDSDLFAANASRVPKIVLGADVKITRPDPVMISGSLTIDLNGHSISGYAVDNVPLERIFYVDKDKSLTLSGPGALKDCHADEGGAIYNRGTLILHDVTFTGCSAGLGGAIYNNGTLGMSGAIVAGDNTGDNNVPDNVYLAGGTVITVKGPFTKEARIGVRLAGGAGIITSGYSVYNSSTDPDSVFSSDDAACHFSLQNGEVELSRGYYYNVTWEKTYASQQALLDETGRDLSGAQFLLSILFPDRAVSARAISYTYRSADPQGNPVKLSALIYIPDAALNGTKALTGICLTNHGTIASNAECPTMRAQFEGAFAWKNYAIVMPDYYGFGASADRPQGYLDAENTAHNSIDAYLAAVQLLKDREVRIPDKLFSFGYSQGGFNSMANLKYVSKHPELQIHFDAVMCGGSPFDVMETWKAYTNGTFHNSLAFVPMTLVSINETHQLGLSYSDLFKGELLAKWPEWILSKQYTTSQISKFLSPDPQHPAAISDILTDDMIAGTGAAFNAIKSFCESYSLTSGWVPPSGTKIILYHSKQDDTVPYANLTAMKAFFGEVAPGCYTAYDGNDGGHIDAVVRFVLDIITEW